MGAWCSRPAAAAAAAAVVWTPGFNRFAEAQALSGAADALVAVSLAGSLFFSLSPDASREQVLLYLADQHGAVRPAGAARRAGHRPLPPSATAGSPRSCSPSGRPAPPRSAFTLLDLALYFFALALLDRAAKASGVVRQALVPGLVDEPDQLVAANSRLARLNVIAGAVGGGDRRRRPRRHRLARRHARPSPAPRSPRPAIATLLLPQITPHEVLDAERRVRGAARADDRRHGVGVHGRSAPPSGSSCSGSPSPCAATSEPAWMYGAAVAAYGVGTFVGNAVAPVLRRRFGEDRLTAGALGRPRRRRSRSAPSARPGRSSCSCPSCSAASPRSPARASTRWSRPTPRWRRAAARSPASRPGSSSAGSPAPSPRRPSPSRSATAWPSLAVAADPGRRAVRARPARGPRRPTSRTRSTRSRSPAAASTTPSSGTVATSTASPSPSWPASSTSPGPRGSSSTSRRVVRLDALRAAAVSTWPLDTREVDWAMVRAVPLVERLERRRADGSRRRRPPSPTPIGRAGDGPAATPPADPQASPGGDHRRRRDRPLRRRAGRSSARPCDQSASER